MTVPDDGGFPASWRPTDEDRRLLARDCERQGIDLDSEDPRLVAIVVEFIRSSRAWRDLVP